MGRRLPRSGSIRGKGRPGTHLHVSKTQWGQSGFSGQLPWWGILGQAAVYGDCII